MMFSFSTPRIIFDGFLNKKLGNTCHEILLKNYIKKLPSSPVENTCCICLEDTSEIKTLCNHIYHKECLGSITNNSCPMCRSVLY
jgi:hypothetical protein